MRKDALGMTVAALLAVVIFGATGLAEDFQRTYRLPANGSIRIRTVSGEVRIQGYDGPNIVVEGFKVGRDRDRVEIVDMSGADRVDVSVRYPESGSNNASVSFQVRVPRSISYNFENVRSVSGNVYLTDVTGQVRAVSVSGSVEVKNVSGLVSAASTSGNVDVYIKKIEGSGDMKFSSISGNVAVKAPPDLDANVEMSTTSGSLATDFPIEVHDRRYAPGRWARGRLGTGACSIRITSVSGRVSLIRS
jgi:DUF4097 and DUF4098 domain-containing protein YvlB